MNVGFGIATLPRPDRAARRCSTPRSSCRATASASTRTARRSRGGHRSAARAGHRQRQPVRPAARARRERRAHRRPQPASPSSSPPIPGRAAITGDPADFEAFDVPQLRGIARTAPYFHDNSHETLRDVVDTYSRFVLPFITPLNLPAVHPPEQPGGRKDRSAPPRRTTCWPSCGGFEREEEKQRKERSDRNGNDSEKQDDDDDSQGPGSWGQRRTGGRHCPPAAGRGVRSTGGGARLPEVGRAGRGGHRGDGGRSGEPGRPATGQPGHGRRGADAPAVLGPGHHAPLDGERRVRGPRRRRRPDGDEHHRPHPRQGDQRPRLRDAPRGRGHAARPGPAQHHPAPTLLHGQPGRPLGHRRDGGQPGGRLPDPSTAARGLAVGGGSGRLTWRRRCDARTLQAPFATSADPRCWRARTWPAICPPPSATA